MAEWIEVEENCPTCHGTTVVDVDAEDEEGRPIQGADNCPNPDCKDGKVQVYREPEPLVEE